MDKQFLHSIHISPEFVFSQTKNFEMSLAMVVFPTPLVPDNKID